MIVLDTHAWVWFLADPGRLSRRARQAVDAEARGGEIAVSSISVWEIAMLVERGRLTLTMDVDQWLAHAEALPFLSFVPVNNRIALQSVRLRDFPGSDPADRIIVATAMLLGATLVTRDERMRRYPRVRAIW
ncbi:MAG: type II toxin-antitoxin system VapC family toxin [Armatimonadetes bacterium]|nr:type II toxin-antitoxin system VapC family toxin [Armatimonadota bacterium]